MRKWDAQIGDAAAGGDGCMRAIGIGDPRETSQSIRHHRGAGRQMTFRPVGQHLLAKTGDHIHAHGQRMAFGRALQRRHKRGLARAAAAHATAMAFAAPVRIPKRGVTSAICTMPPSV